MLVKDLIDLLKKCEPDAPVFIRVNIASYSTLQWVEHNIESSEVWLNDRQPNSLTHDVIYMETKFNHDIPAT